MDGKERRREEELEQLEIADVQSLAFAAVIYLLIVVWQFHFFNNFEC